MRRARLATLTIVAISLAPAGTAPTSLHTTAVPLRAVAAGGVLAHVPRIWEVRALPSPGVPLAGIQASPNLDRWSAEERSEPGIEAYWVDATAVGVPSHFYRLVASGPAMERLRDGASCRSVERRIWTHREQGVQPAGDYVATATGTCGGDRVRTRWGAFVAAPGFGTTRPMGIARSGLYVALVSVREGPGAAERVNRLLASVSFGGTSVRSFLDAVGAPPKVA